MFRELWTFWPLVLAAGVLFVVVGGLYVGLDMRRRVRRYVEQSGGPIWERRRG